MLRWDVQCQTCGQVHEMWAKTREIRDKFIPYMRCGDFCDPPMDCSGRIVLKPHAVAFTVNGYSAKNGYSK